MATRIRDRNRSVPDCTRFNFSHVDARFDKIEIAIDIGEIIASGYHDIKAHFDLLALDGNYKRAGWGSTTSLINHHDDRLFNYRLVAKQPSGGVAILQAIVQYNPTRIFAYWGDTFPNAENLNRKIWKDPRLYASQIRLSRNGNDNFIPTSKLAAAQALDWDSYAVDVLSLITISIHEEIALKARAERMMITIYPEQQWKWTIQSVEVYWEFKHADAAGALSRMFINAQSQFTVASERFFIDRSLSTIGSSHTYELQRKNTRCCAYAKLGNRIRLECRFLVNPRQIYSDQVSLEHHPNHNLDFLKGFLHVLITKAIKLMQPFTEFDECIFTTPQTSISDFVLLSKKLEKLDQDATQEVMSALVDSGRIAIPAPKTPVAKVIRRLKTNGLLVKGPHKRKQVPFYYAQGELARITVGLRKMNEASALKSTEISA